MTEFDKVMNMLNKNVELSSEKVELATAQELRDMYGKLKDTSSTNVETTKLLQDASNKLANNGKSLRMQAEAFMKEVAKFENDAKALGLDVPKDIKDLKSFAKGFTDLSSKMLKSAADVDKVIGSIK